jgi:DNA-binding response OmpR family regulator
MKILVIEDNEGLAKRIRRMLQKTYVVDIAPTGSEGAAQAEALRYEVILLDLGLPDMHGLEVCKAIRRNGVQTPILILTGVNDLQSRVQLLNHGADDYLSKPFNGEELVARIAALARRQPQLHIENILELDDLQINVSRREVRRSGVLIPLRRKEFEILHYLVANQGRAVSRQMILDHAWENTKDRWNNSVDVHIKRLRDKIDRPFPKPLIKTAYGIGYMVESAPVNN